MRSVIRLFSIFLISHFSVGCTTFVSGNNSIPAKHTDSIKFYRALQIPRNAPLISHEIDGRHVRIYKVAFDGTLNDRERVPSDERETIIARIATLVRANKYYPGVGMQGEGTDMQDALTGGSSTRTAEVARNKFFEQAKRWLSEDSEAEIRVFVTGFSRGAATARHFMNIVSKEWDELSFRASQLAVGNSSSLRFYVLLYDTVATGQQGQLALSLPSRVDYAVHFIATDEPRSLLFRPTVDIDADASPTDAEYFGDGPTPPKRLNNLYLPGAHSDVGASYPEGVGNLYVLLTEQFLYMMGLTKTNCWDIRYDPFVGGKHDSRGILDKLFGSPDPDSVKDVNRQAIGIKMAILRDQEKAETENRLRALWNANGERMASTFTSIRNSPMASFKLRWSGLELEPIGTSDEVISTSVKLTKSDDIFQLGFVFVEGNAEANVMLTPSVLSRISTDGSVVSMTYLDVRGTSSIAIFVDDVLSDLIPTQKGPETRLRPDRDYCLAQADGSSKIPLEVLVIHNDGTVSTPYDPDLE